MTIVIAQRRDQEILILSDTTIIEPDKTRNDVFPGRLKVVIIGPQVTVAFGQRRSGHRGSARGAA